MKVEAVLGGMQGFLHAFKRSGKKPSEEVVDSESFLSGQALAKSLSLPSGDENLDPGSPLRPTKLLAGLPSTPQSYQQGRRGPAADFFAAPNRSSLTISRMSDSDSDVSIPAARPAASQSSFAGPVSFRSPTRWQCMTVLPRMSIDSLSPDLFFDLSAN